MNKMKRIFSFVLAFVITLGAFSSFSTMALAAEDNKEDEKPEATAEENKEEGKEEKEEGKEEEKEEGKEEEKEDEEKPAEEKPETGGDSTEFLKEVPSDVKGTEYEDAVTRLVAFGVIGGYPDGTYKPEREVNRAQFAKIIVEALNLDDANKATIEGNTGFSDVAAGYWAAGYVNIASSQGLIKGFPDGTFRPAAKVSYAQALTILVRALGYEDQFLYGNWPSNYISKAAELGITGAANIPSNYNEGALRGNIAKLVDKTLTKHIIKVTKYEGTAITYEPTDITLLEHALGFEKQSNVRIVGDQFVENKLGENEVRIFKNLTADKEKIDDQVVSMKNSAVAYRQYIGKKVTVYLDGDDVILVEDNDKSESKFEFVKDAYTVRKDELELELAGSNAKYRLADKAVFYVFNSADNVYDRYDGKSKIEEKLATSLKGRVGRVVVDGGDIVYAEIMSDKLIAGDFMVVKENKDDVIKGISGVRGDDELNYSEKSSFKGVHAFNQDGKKIDVEDIKAGDIAYAQKQYFGRQDQMFITVVQDNNVTGELGRVTNEKMDIGEGSEYIAAVKNAVVTDTKNENVGRVSVDLLESSEQYTKDLASELYEEDVIAYRGAGDLVVMLAANDEGAGANFGVINRVFPSDGRVEIITSLDGKKMETLRFDLENEDDIYDLQVVDVNGKTTKKNVNSAVITGAKTDTEALVGQPVRFRINKNDRIADGSLRFVSKEAKFKSIDIPAPNAANKHARLSKSSIHVLNSEDLVGNTKQDLGLKVAESAKVVEMYSKTQDIETLNTGNMDARKFRDVADDVVIYDYEDVSMTEADNRDFEFAVFTRANGEVEAIVLYGESADQLTDVRSYEESIIVTDLGLRGDDYDAKYHSYQAGKKDDAKDGSNFKEERVEKASLQIIEINRRGRISVVKPNADDKFDDANPSELYDRIEKEQAVKVGRNDTLTINGKTVQVARNAVVYDNSGRDLVEMRLRDIEDNDTISAIITKGNVAEVIVRNKTAKQQDDKDEKDKEVDLNVNETYTVISLGGKDGERTVLLEDLKGNLSKDIKISNSAYEKINGATSLVGKKVKVTLNRDKTEIIAVEQAEVELTLDVPTTLDLAVKDNAGAKEIEKAIDEAIASIKTNVDLKLVDVTYDVEALDSADQPHANASEITINADGKIEIAADVDVTDLAKINVKAKITTKTGNFAGLGYVATTVANEVETLAKGITVNLIENN